jgi:pimeloyl-ACP methyl ester carboxylesterase
MMRRMVREHRVDLSGRTTRYLESGAGWPLVLLHAFPLSAEMWRPQLEHAPRGWRLIAPDIRGFGASPFDTASVPTMDEYAADVVALLDHLELERAVIGGLSMGGYITFALLRLAPERFSGVLLADTRPQVDSAEARESRRALSELVRTAGPSAVADQMIPGLLGETTRRARPEVEREVRRLIVANEAEGIDGAIHAMLHRADSTGGLARITMPTLVITGEEDVLIPVRDAEALHRAIPRSQLVVLPRAGHLANIESPDDFSEALQNFLLSNL